MNTNVHFSSNTDLWSTPQDFYDELNKEFNFELDPCATHENAKCALYYTKDDNGLEKSWRGMRVFMNPPLKIYYNKHTNRCYQFYINRPSGGTI